MNRTRSIHTDRGVAVTVVRTGRCPACRGDVLLVYDPTNTQLRVAHERALCTGFDRDPESEYGLAVVWTPRRGAD